MNKLNWWISLPFLLLGFGFIYIAFQISGNREETFKEFWKDYLL